jgi:hypothetical protein
VTSVGEFISPVARVARVLRLAAGVVFTALLVFAPLNFGSTREGGPELVAAGCIGATLLWAVALACHGPRAQVPLVAVAGVTLLTLAALPWITGLASLTPVAAFTQTHFAQVAARWPYSIVWRTPTNALVLTLALAASVLPLIDLARSRGWALTFSLALTGTGAAVGVLALLQNYTHATGIYWRNDGRMPGNFCGTFYHHTAAGAYFNTAWPLAVGLTWLAWNRADRATGEARLAAKTRGRNIPLTTLGGLAIIILLAAHGSHVSRLPQLLAVIVAPFLLFGLKIRSYRFWLFAAGGVAAIAVIITVAGRTTEIRERWRLMFIPVPVGPPPVTAPESAWPGLMRDDLFISRPPPPGWLGDRSESWRTALRSIAARPFIGHGPGNWMGAASQNTKDPFVRTFFQSLQFAYQDTLQFAAEWGVTAALAWWGLLAGAVVAVLRPHRWLSPLHRPLGIAAACALAAVLLQAQVDSPLEMPAITFNVIVLAALCWAAATALPRPAPSVHDR